MRATSAPIFDTPEKREAARVLAAYLKPQIEAANAVKGYGANETSIVDFSQRCYYIPETFRPIVLLPHEIIILREMFERGIPYQTYLYSTVKKSGKTTVTSMVGRWVAECKERWGVRNEIYSVANDMEQARGLVYQKILNSISLHPDFKPKGDGGVLPNRWRILHRDATCLSTGSVIKALSNDYAGEAGSNPTATLWTEIWGLTSEKSKKLWGELTPVPTRPHSFRFIDTYAGYENESEILWNLWNSALNSRQLTHDDVPDWPFDESKLPLYVNEKAHLFAYIDTGEIARRMPWQTNEYYEAQASDPSLDAQDFRRLHLNEWTSSISSLVEMPWYDSCEKLYPLPDQHTPIILGVDAAVSNDCCAISAISRDPDNYSSGTAQRFGKIWNIEDQPGKKFDYGETIEPYIREACAKYNVVQVAYDAYQLHDLMTRLTKEGVAWCRSFSQNADRMKADKALVDMIRDRHFKHMGDPDFRKHITNAAAKKAIGEDTKLRIVKKSQSSKIDGTVATSMANYECLRLNI